MKSLRIKFLSAFLIGTIFIAFSSSTGLHTGNSAPEIISENPEGVKTTLSSLKGNIVLIEFWASWCKPCRLKHPELVRVYNQFKDSTFKTAKGFEIYSVSLDQNKTAWLAAIEKDKLSWNNHVSDLSGWDSKAVRDYRFNAIPHNILLDENGLIIGTDLFGENLIKKLKSLR
jgi:thiol-disulfide isomerase/thioredoxin